MSLSILLYNAQVDWVTLTSYDSSWWRRWRQRIANAYNASIPRKIMQYDGLFCGTPDGSIFLGAGSQSGTDHYMMRVSGSIADDISSMWIPEVGRDECKASRIDIQMTIQEPEDWSQYDLFRRLRDKPFTIGWMASAGERVDELATVYIGSRNSERMTRCYEKETVGGNKLLRIETEYKGKRAAMIASRIAKGGGQAVNFLQYEIQHIIKDSALLAAFTPYFYGQPETVYVTDKTDKERQQAWLLNQVLPTFKRHISDHDSDGIVAHMFYKALATLDMAVIMSAGHSVNLEDKGEQ